MSDHRGTKTSSGAILNGHEMSGSFTKMIRSNVTMATTDSFNVGATRSCKIFDWVRGLGHADLGSWKRIMNSEVLNRRRSSKCDFHSDPFHAHWA